MIYLVLSRKINDLFVANHDQYAIKKLHKNPVSDFLCKE